ncbi:MAG: VTT domain-containing protein [Bacteroidia bacterium]|nr:VTT domain-containing protein [Bacteroidia bacterium]
MLEAWEFLKELINPETIIHKGGLVLLLFVIFAETGLFVGFFLPGDSLVFVSGLLCASQPELLGVSIYVLLPCMMAAAIIGNIAGYWFGYRVGPPLFKRDDSLIFKKKYLEVTRSFYQRHGAKALILGRFLPIIRTFAPILAGVIRVNFARFTFYNISGAVAWIGSIGITGYLLGDVPAVRENLEYILIFLIIITIIPVIRTYRKERAGQKNTPPSS